jgi:hypothetical protein
LQIIPILIATVSFVVWVLAMGHNILNWNIDPRLASTAVVVWAFLIPIFYTGSDPGSRKSGATQAVAQGGSR